jgi:regulator of PEP synthase PpsR (kinase-PPPase family)
MRTRGKDYDFTWLEQRLQPLGFRLVFVTRSPDSFAAVRLERLKISGNPHQYDNLQTYIEEQELMRRLVGESRLPVFTIDISDNNVPVVVEGIANWMESTGGLWMD